MATTRPDSDPLDETTSTLTGTTSQSTISNSVKLLDPSTTLLSTITVSTTTDSTSSSVVAAESSSATASPTLLAAVPSISSTDIQWGPAVTASPLADANSSSDPSPNQHHDHFTKSSRQITIATSIIGGAIIVALLIYALRQRRRGATFAEIARLRPHNPSTISFSQKGHNARLTALPIHREWRYSVRSSRHAPVQGVPRAANSTSPVPPEIAQRFHSQNPYVKNLWKTAHPPSAPRTPLREAHSYEDDDESISLKKPEEAHAALDGSSIHSYASQKSRDGQGKAGTLSVTERALSLAEASPPTPPDSPHSQQHLHDRWSWTNSQAPATPRMYAPSMRSSVSSLPRFRNIRSWVRGQTERIDEERPATGSAQEAKMPILKNKASWPKLAPPPPVKRKLSKTRPSDVSNVRVGSLASILMQQPGKDAALAPAQSRPKVERSVTAASTEVRQR